MGLFGDQTWFLISDRLPQVTKSTESMGALQIFHVYIYISYALLSHKGKTMGPFQIFHVIYFIYNIHYRQVSNIRHTLIGNEIVDNSDVVWASPVGAAPTTSWLST